MGGMGGLPVTLLHTNLELMIRNFCAIYPKLMSILCPGYFLIYQVDLSLSVLLSKDKSKILL
jgi:hypothetical protein